MTPLRILHVVRAGRAEGGMENGIVNLVNGMDDRFAPSICALDSEETFSTKIKRPGVQYFLLPPYGQGVDWGLVKRLASLIRRERFEIVHSHNWGTFIYGVLAGRLARVGVIHGEHGKNFTELAAEGRAKRLAKTWLGRQADLLLSVCEDIRGEWMARYGIRPERIRTIQNGVDSVRFRPASSAESRHALGLPADAFIAGTVGRLDPVKNLPAFVGAVGRLAREMPALHAVFVGSGPLEDELRQMVESRSLAGRVHFAGLRREVEQFLPAFDVFVLPSFSEGMSNVLLEAMSCGVLPLCRDLASHREIVTPGTDAVLIEPCDESNLADALRTLSRDPVFRSQLANNARQTILKRFTLERMFRNYENAYLETSARRRGGARP
jgi:glycosyltransferase involved in cell wall biosynthesis